MPQVVVPSCAAGFIYIPQKLGLCRLLLCSLMMFANNRVHYVPMVVLVCLHIKLPHYDHYADPSEGINLLFELTYLSYNCENTYILSYYHQI